MAACRSGDFVAPFKQEGQGLSASLFVIYQQDSEFFFHGAIINMVYFFMASRVVVDVAAFCGRL
jgi:hypothetical protein